MNPLDSKIDRRKFIGAIGGSCVVLSAAVVAKKIGSAQPGGVQQNSRQGPPRERAVATNKKKATVGTLRTMTTDVLVVGGGMAGVFAAVKAHDAGARVLLVDKGSVGKSGQTPFARGIFRFDEEETGMSKEEYLAQTAEASEYMNNETYTALLLDHSAERIDELRSWGFFDSACYADSLRRPLVERRIPIRERVTLTHLLEDAGHVVGAMGLFIDTNETLVVHSKAVVLCTGASGFKPSGWQIGSLTSDGDAMAYRVGAEITGKEWCDGHAMKNRGLEGLAHVTSRSSISPMLGVEVNVEVSRNGPITSMGPPPRRQASAGDQAPEGNESGRGPAWRQRPPGGPPPGGGPPGGGPPRAGAGRGGHHGPPPGLIMGGASAGMSIHKAEGVFPADSRCASNVPGLYAAGDALGSMQTGGIYTQVGSSLAGSAVQGAIAGQAAAEFSRTASIHRCSDARIEKISAEIFAPLLRERGFSPRWVTQTLQGVMIPNFILYVKNENRLRAALTYIEYLRDKQVPLLMANDLHELRQAHETANMVLNAEMKLRASLMRTESRGSHYREDYPGRNDDQWMAWIKIHRRADGKMLLCKHPVDRSRA